MRLLAAPCSFKESLTASAASATMIRIASGFGHVVEAVPLADGGEGTLDALAGPLGLAMRASVIRGMLDGEKTARWGLDAKNARAVIEAAEVIGLPHVPLAQRDPWRASTHGLGALIVEAGARGARTVLLGLGGTGTVDGGRGMREAIAAANSRGALIPSITALVDVDVPLAGARMFMKQKLGPHQGDDVIDALDARLRAMFTDDIARAPGAGAAGGLGAAVLALGGALVPGAQLVMDALAIEERIARADVVWTGEGRIDEQSMRGKAIAALARLCGAARVPLAAFCGATHGDLSTLFALGVTDVITITPAGQSLDEALARADENLASAAARALSPRRAVRRRHVTRGHAGGGRKPRGQA
jgi:glycerate kinase